MSQTPENGLGEAEVDRILEEFLRTTEESIRILQNWSHTEEIDLLEQRLAGVHSDWEELHQFLDETQIEEIIENYANNRLRSQNADGSTLALTSEESPPDVHCETGDATSMTPANAFPGSPVNEQHEFPSPGPSGLQQGLGRNQSRQSINKGDHRNFKIVKENSVDYKNLKAAQKDTYLVLNKPPNDPAHQKQWIIDTFNEILLYFLNSTETNPGDRVQLDITSQSNPEQPLFITPRRGDQLSVETIFSRLEKVLNSNKKFLLAGPLKVKFSVVRFPVGFGNFNKSIRWTWSFDDYCRKTKGIISISNKDTLCLARAIVVAIGFVNRENSPESHKLFKKISRKDRADHQRTKAIELCRTLGINLDNGATLEHVHAFQDGLPDYTITVFGDRSGRKVIFEGPPSTDNHPRKHIDLLFENEHYVPITSLTSAFQSSYYCRKCRLPYSSPLGHYCPQGCSACKSVESCDKNQRRIFCNYCNRTFLGQQCFYRHFEPYTIDGKSICDSIIKCKQCCKVYLAKKREKNKHFCEEMRCLVCNKYVQRGHRCFIQPIKNNSEERTGFMFVFFDLEATQSKPGDKPGEFLHEPNLLVARTYCVRCLGDVDLIGSCAECGERERVFRGFTCVEDFLTFLQRPRKGIKQIVCLSHYGSGYDNVFILKKMISEKHWNPKIISNG
ncbi:unnamed protein product [Bemisia tabaci]|uniref:DNA-directed DNA polymerase n=1 Tax=Bemisia tabaci TaxID=7038 RepID=A0A9P0F524_BEMTA|nr:unnamed protein product [Bemisia tabaci]